MLPFVMSTNVHSISLSLFDEHTNFGIESVEGFCGLMLDGKRMEDGAGTRWYPGSWCRGSWSVSSLQAHKSRDGVCGGVHAPHKLLNRRRTVAAGYLAAGTRRRRCSWGQGAWYLPVSSQPARKSLDAICAAAAWLDCRGRKGYVLIATVVVDRLDYASVAHGPIWSYPGHQTRHEGGQQVALAISQHRRFVERVSRRSVTGCGCWESEVLARVLKAARLARVLA